MRFGFLSGSSVLASKPASSEPPTVTKVSALPSKASAEPKASPTKGSGGKVIPKPTVGEEAAVDDAKVDTGPKRIPSRSARRKATKRMLRRTGVLPYAGVTGV